MKSKVNLKPLQDKIKNLEKKSALAANRTIQQDFRRKFLDLISKGISPIDGRGRFEAYIAQRESKRRGYPDTVTRDYPDKRRRPVNLKLSGKFLREFEVTIKKLNLLEYGFFDQNGYGATLEEGHRTGHNNQAERPIIPIGAEKLVKQLDLLILKIYRDAVNSYLRKK